MSEEIKKLVRTRAVGKGWLVRSAKALTSLLGETELSRLELEDVIADFDRRLHMWDEAQTAVELECEPGIMDTEIEQADVFRWDVRSCRLQATQKLAHMTAHKTEPGKSAHSVNSGSADSLLSNAKLPRIELSKLCGDVLKWQSYWEQFEALVGDSTLPNK